MRASHLTLKAVAAASLAVVTSAAFATNGMNMEAFGAKPGGMGGASFAYDSGNSAVMNNPATLVLGKEGSDFGIGLTVLQPDVTNKVGSFPTAESTATAFYMPSMSWIKKSGNVAFGAAMLAQGGMGTDYASGWSGQANRSEVAFGRLMAPLAWKVNDQLSIAGQVDFIWAGMDMQMDMLATDMAAGMGAGTIVGSGTLFANSNFYPNIFNTQSTASTSDDTPIANRYARFNFTNRNDFTGAAMGSGFGGKIGATYQLSKDLAIGATYHSKSALSDLKGRGTIETTNGTTPSVIAGDYAVKDFEWPSTMGVGISWNATNRLMLVADYKRINWSDTMDVFKIGFVSDAGETLDISMDQKWSDQDVYMIGAQYKLTDNFAVRVGYNYASNPINDNFLNPLFPAIIEEHYTFGAGWQINTSNSVAFSMSYAPEVSQTNSAMTNSFTSTHSQTTWRINYNYHF